ncbi:MAG: hypothetical protein ACI9UU_001043 [Candidatus Azotimanducaceae bacterium]|jgi:hypothetical protein
MTEYEFLDFVTTSVAVITQSGFDFISIFFAYLVCAYLVGSKISRVQAFALTIAYTIYLSFNVMTIVTTLERVIGAAKNTAPDMVARFEVMQLAGPSLLTFIWIISIVYMFSQNLNKDPTNAGAV